MLIKSIMTPLRELITVGCEEPVGDAFKLIDDNGFLSIPVMDKRELAGFISKQYVYDSFFKDGTRDWEEFLKRPIKDFLHEELESVFEDTYVEEAADIFFKKRIRFLPVKDLNGHFTGIVTQKSLFGIIAHVYGLTDPKIVLILDDMRGSLARVTDIITKNGGDIRNIVNFDTEVMGLQELTIRLVCDETGCVERIAEKLKESGFKIKEIS